MRLSRSSLVVALAVLLMGVAGCGHKLVAVGDQHTIKIYPDEATYVKVRDMKKQGGPMGMLGGLGENFMTKEVDNNTPVRIVSKDDQGAQIEVADGPNKGVQGFVAKENVD